MLDVLFAEHAKALLAYTRTLVNDHHLAEDIVQETLIRAWRHAERLHSTEGSVRGWLLTVARNLAIDWLRSAASRHESVGAEDWDLTLPDHAEAVAASVEAVALLRKLSTEHRAVLLHTYLGGRTAQETARLLGVPVGTVKSRRHYALTVLRANRLRPAP
ncbi:sigma-70 family RNA polymerase sigma factor [Couchioplanes caeruleus]|uniref:sigma-70 family RNA polymerase sigma factor n=1 Tax=Couchioplanes caeruleus TaxID=56438 RepID=UPI00373FE16C